MNTRKAWVRLAIVVTIAITVFLFFGVKSVAKTENIIEVSQDEDAIPEPKKEFVLPQILLDIAYAESRDDQSKVGKNYRYRTVTDENGNEIKERYIWSQDIGRFQINDYWNKDWCLSHGYDIYTYDGNTGCAILLYEKYGTTPWNPSKYCWIDIQACKEQRKEAYYKHN